MGSGNVIVTEEDYARFMGVLEGLDDGANAKFVFLFDKAGQQIAAAGELDEIDPTSLASLTAGNVAATEGVAQFVGEAGFTNLFHEGRKDSLHISVVADRLILLVAFDERSSLGLVRLRVEQHMAELGSIVTDMFDRNDGGGDGFAEASASVSQITDADIDALFGE